MNNSRILSKLYNLFTLSYCLVFMLNGSGKEYGVSPLAKLRLSIQILRNHRKLDTLTTWKQHLLLVEEILRVPASLKGSVIECGCFNGSSTIPLSLACALTGRQLFVCDSFEGMPNPREDEKYTKYIGTTEYYAWEKGEFGSVGGLQAVKRNVQKMGNIGVCTFMKGYFCDTLKDIETGPVVLVFEDANLVSSVEDCLRYLWPKLQDGCKFYCHEPWSVDVVSLFYDKQWWMDNLHVPPPGFVGSEQGTILDFRYYNAIGYAKKYSIEKIKSQGKQRITVGCVGYKERTRKAGNAC